MRIVAVVVAFASAPCAAAERPIVPVPTDAVVRVLDGDTLQIDAEIIRLAYIDAPETTRARCDVERILGEKAKASLKVWAAQPLALRRVGLDKYHRTLAELYVVLGGDLLDVNAALVEMGHAVEYDGGQRRDWCSLLH